MDIKKFILGLLSDGGKVSSMRLVFLIMMLLTALLTIITLFREDSLKALALFSGMYATVAGGKLIQKGQEVKSNEKQNNTVSPNSSADSPAAKPMPENKSQHGEVHD